MKRVIPLCLILLLLLVGCDLRNHQNSEDFIPTGTYGNYHSYDQAGNREDPLIPQEKNAVKTVLSYTGEVPLSQPTSSYSYQLPMIDLAGAHAAGCNRDIEDFFGSMIRSSMKSMEHYEEPLLERLDYSSFTISGILTLRVDRRDYDGSESQAWYTVDAETGEEIPVKRFFEAAGISGEPQAAVAAAVEKLFARRFGTPGSPEAQTPYSTALFRTTEALRPLSGNRMHLNENGKLTTAIELFSPNGGSTVEELILP